MDYSIWLSYNNQQEGFQFPVNPGSIEIGDGSSSQTYDVVGVGEINIIKSPKLTEYSFSGLFPAQRYHFLATNSLFAPQFYIELIRKWMNTKRPVRFVFIGDSFDINEAVSIEGFDWKEVAGSGGDIEYTLKLKKYVFYTARKATVTPAGQSQEVRIQKAPAPRPGDKQSPKTYTVAAGDTLWKVARKALGDDTRWPEIQKLNNIPDVKLKSLAVGTVLKLPAQGGTTSV